jgi:hypothetical protein
MSNQVYGFIASDCEAITRMKHAFLGGQLTNFPPVPRNPETGITGLESYVLLESLGPENQVSESGGTLFQADALRLEPTAFPVWYIWVPVTSEDLIWTFKLTYNGTTSGLLLNAPGDIQAFLRSAGATGCTVWGQGTSIVYDDGSTDAITRNYFFVAFEDGTEPAELTGQLWVTDSGGGTGVDHTGMVPSMEPIVCTRRLDMLPLDGVETISLAHPIRWTDSFRQGEIVDALPQPGRGSRVVTDGRKLGPQPYILVNPNGSSVNSAYYAGSRTVGYAMPAGWDGMNWGEIVGAPGLIEVHFDAFTGVAFTGQMIWVATDVPIPWVLGSETRRSPYGPRHYAVAGGNTTLSHCTYVAGVSSVSIHYQDSFGNDKTCQAFANNWTRVCLRDGQYVIVAVDSRPGFTPFNIIGVGGPCCPSPCDASSIVSSSSTVSSSSIVSSSSLSDSSSTFSSSVTASSSGSTSSSVPTTSSSSVSPCGTSLWVWGFGGVWLSVLSSCTGGCHPQLPAYAGDYFGEYTTTDCA